MTALLRPCFVFVFLVVAACPLYAQDNNQAGPSINYRVRPHFPFDAQRLKKRPVIDGMLSDNEWDALYTVSDGPATGVIYMNWDDENLYLAARADSPAWVVFDLDLNGDGWLRGADNVEIAVAPLNGSGAPPVTLRLLDAAGTKDSPVWMDRAIDPKTIQVAAKMNGSASVVELAIPRGAAGLKPRSGATIGVRGDFLPGSATLTPTQPYEPHLLVDASLVESHVTSVAGIAPRLSIDDVKVVSGQNISATLDLSAQTDEITRVKSITWKGDGPAADLLKLVRDPNVAPIAYKKPLRVKYNTVIPDTAPPGFYQLTVTAELDGGRSVVATKSFSVVEPFTVSLRSEPDVVKMAGDQNKCKAVVEVESAIRGYERGDVELDVPVGWVVEGRKKRGFNVLREDSLIRNVFTLGLPANTAAGDYVVNATVTWKGRSWKAQKTIHVERAVEAAPSAKPPQSE